MLSDKVCNNEGSNNNDRYCKVKIILRDTLLHESEGNKGQHDNKTSRNGKKRSNVQHDSAIEEKQKTNKHQKHSNQKLI